MDPMEWPQKIKYLRLCNGYKTRKSLATITGLTATTIYYLERGYCHPRPSHMTEEELIGFAAGGETGATGAGPAVVRDLGDLVRHVRHSKNLTQSQLATITGVTRTTINHIERGRVRPKRGTVQVLLEEMQRHFGEMDFVVRCS